MLTEDGIQVVEFNCRFGDPETQVVLPMMDAPLLDLLATVAEGGSLRGRSAPTRAGSAVTTVVASGGYPGSYTKGMPISIPESLESDEVLVFHAGTKVDADGLVTSGGRVLAVTALAPDLGSAADTSQAGAEAITFEGAFHRRDIGWRERARLEHRGS
jgi:phosphoribosylamine--glycine ligase